MKKDNSSKTSYISMIILGALAILLGFGVVLDGMVGYGYPFFSSISESATTGVEVGMILPFVLGAMSVFFLGYRGYDWVDNICAKVMALGSFGVAMQVCASQYSELYNKVGAFALSPHISNIIHGISAILLFGTMIFWIGTRFTKGVLDPTPQKKWRNRIYKSCSLLALGGILWFIIGNWIFPGGPNVFIAEELILIPLGFAVMVKGGAFLKDKEENIK